jgi:uncharacterized protein
MGSRLRGNGNLPLQPTTRLCRVFCKERQTAANSGRSHQPNVRTFMRCLALAFLLAVATLAAAQLTPFPPQRPESFIADPDHLLKDEVGAGRLRDLAQRQGSQLAVIVVSRTEPEPIEDFAQRVFTTWKLGRKGVDDGVLFVLAPGNTIAQMRIHVGFGLEGAIPDVVAKRILVERVRPAFAKDGPTAATAAAIAALLELIHKADVAPKGVPITALDPTEGRMALGIIAMLFLTAFAAVGLLKPIAMLWRRASVWIAGVLAAVLYAWIAGHYIFTAAALAWLATALLFHTRFIPLMHRKAERIAEAKTEPKRRVAVRQGRDPAQVRVIPLYERASGMPPGELGAMPWILAVLSFAGATVAFGFSVGGIALAAGWTLLATFLALLMNGALLADLGTRVRLRPGGGDGASDGDSSDSGSGDDSGGDSGGGGASA